MKHRGCLIIAFQILSGVCQAIQRLEYAVQPTHFEAQSASANSLDKPIKLWGKSMKENLTKEYEKLLQKYPPFGVDPTNFGFHQEDEETRIVQEIPAQGEAASDSDAISNAPTVLEHADSNRRSMRSSRTPSTSPTRSSPRSPSTSRSPRTRTPSRDYFPPPAPGLHCRRRIRCSSDYPNRPSKLITTAVLILPLILFGRWYELEILERGLQARDAAWVGGMINEDGMGKVKSYRRFLYRCSKNGFWIWLHLSRMWFWENKMSPVLEFYFHESPMLTNWSARTSIDDEWEPTCRTEV